MQPLTVPELSLGAVAIPYTVLALRWAVRRLRLHTLVTRLASYEPDPYYAHMATAPEPGEFVAVADLVRLGFVEVDPYGELHLTAAGRDPDRSPRHPVPAGVLDWLRSRPAPGSLSQLRSDEVQFRAIRDWRWAHHEALPRWIRRGDSSSCCFLVAFIFFAAIAAGMILGLTYDLAPFGLRDAITGLGGLTALGLIAALPPVWNRIRPTKSRGEHVRLKLAAVHHPALTSLSADDHFRLTVSQDDPECPECAVVPSWVHPDRPLR
ncbi:hypothetical protein [Streptomyces sp. NBC_00239]|uniref:hypothetical protein n=1 Tax=Streptomyces sp. NBC_00239 TaxID=2903640 RepID=UPI002E2812F5|nr:hypothetical protein [Streptomyces sp. NBC_00239]